MDGSPKNTVGESTPPSLRLLALRASLAMVVVAVYTHTFNASISTSFQLLFLLTLLNLPWLTFFAGTSVATILAMAMPDGWRPFVGSEKLFLIGCLAAAGAADAIAQRRVRLAGGKRKGWRRLQILLLVLFLVAHLFLFLFSKDLALYRLTWIATFTFFLAGRVRFPSPGEIRDAVRRSAAPGVLMAVSCAVTLVLCELALPWFLPELESAGDIYEPSYEFMYQLKPNSRTEFTFRSTETDWKTIEHVIGPQGIREPAIPPKNKGEYRVLLIGDSYTMGVTVTPEDTISAKLQQALSKAHPGAAIRVINAGIAGGGPLQERGMLLNRGLDLDPDLVVLQLFPGNDYENCIEIERKVLRAYDTRWAQLLQVLWYRSQWPYWMEYALQRHVHLYKAIVGIAGGRPLFSIAVGRFRFSDVEGVPELPPSEPRESNFKPNLTEWYPELERALALCEEEVAALQDVCEQRGIPLLRYCIPFQDTVQTSRWNEVTAWYPEAEYTQYKGLRRMEGIFHDLGIPTVDVLPALESGGPLFTLYYLYDGHLSPKGNAVVAEALAGALNTEITPIVEH